MSVPPYNTPPGAPPPPYDPRMQWRVYREQQKSAWRAQRQAMRAQHEAWKAGMASAYGPRVPSIVGPVILIGVGIVGLLLYSGHIAPGHFWAWYAHWWPMLLILAGLALLGEWALDVRRKTPVRRSGGFVGVLILLALLGFAAGGWEHWGPLRAQWGDENDNFFNFMGLPEHDFDQPAISMAIPANASVQIENPRGDVSVTTVEGNNIQVQAHAVAFAGSDAEAKKVFDAEAAHVTVSGNAVLVQSEGQEKGRMSLNVQVPKGARVLITAGHGDVAAAGLDNGLNINSGHGAVQLNAIKGSVQVHFSGGRGDFSAHQVNGDLTADGNCNDVTFSEISGKVTMNGDIFGDVHMENIASTVHLHTSVTELEVASLPGDMTLSSDDLHVNQAKGQVRVTTRAKDVDLNQVAGDVYVSDTRGQITLEPAGNYNLEAHNGKGDVEITLPASASAIVDGRTHNGDIVSDFPLTISGDESKTVTGNIGGGKARITLTADVGDLRIRKSEEGAVPMPPAPPTPPNAPHLKAPRGETETPVTQ
ncbi:MAG: DUF4097 family beta strand repeat-containing protein [Terracidiphilus sp.]